MTAEAAQNVLQRKASGSQAAVGPTAMDAAKAIRVAMAHAGDSALDVAVGVRSVEVDSIMPEGLTQDPVENALLVQLRDESGALGLAVVCPQCLGAVIEASTLGQVFPSEAELRDPTPTDAMLVNSFLDAFLGGFARLAEEMALPPPVDGYRALVPFEDLRAASMALSDLAHKRFKATVDFGLGAKVGQLEIIIPSHRPAPSDEAVAPDIWASALEKAVLSTSAELEARLCATRATLEYVSSLKVGDLVPLTDASLDSVALVALNGKRVAGARLGRAGLMRAVRVRLAEGEVMGAAMDTLPMTGDAPAMMALPGGGADLDLPAIDGAGLGDAPFDLNATPLGDTQGGDPGGLGGLPMADGMDAAPLDLDLNGGDVLGAIEPAQVPIEEVNIS